MEKAILVLASLAFCGTASGQSDTELVHKFVNCALRATTVGIQGLIPPHNPLHVKDKQFNQTILGVAYKFKLTNIFVYSLMDLELKQVDVTTYTNPGTLNIDYDIYWKLLNITGNFAWSAEELKISGNSTAKILLHHTDFTGIFNLTKPGQVGIKEHVNNFTLKINVEKVEAHIKGAGPQLLTKKAIELAVRPALNNFFVADIMKDARFNGFWLAKPERVDQMIQWCHDVPEV